MIPGINLIGHLDKMMGMGSAARYLLDVLLENDINVHPVNIPYTNHNRVLETRLLNASIRADYPINIIAVNADFLPFVIQKIGNISSHYNIGYWFWEIENVFPFSSSFQYVDEVWCATDFILKTLQSFTDKPVFKSGFSFPKNRIVIGDFRATRKLDDRFIVSSMFDFQSSVDRKNPYGAIEAFERAGIDNASMFIRTLHDVRFPEASRELSNRIRKSRNISLITGRMSVSDYLSFIAASDVFISLHRSEGLGLGILESMQLSRAIIATNYGGNTDFMTVNNSVPIDFKLVDIDTDFHSYKLTAKWADPKIDEATSAIKFLFENECVRSSLGAQASIDVSCMSSVSVRNLLARIRDISAKF